MNRRRAYNDDDDTGYGEFVYAAMEHNRTLVTPKKFL